MYIIYILYILTKDEVELAVGTKYAERAVQAKVHQTISRLPHLWQTARAPLARNKSLCFISRAASAPGRRGSVSDTAKMAWSVSNT